jgi:putative transposase
MHTMTKKEHKAQRIDLKALVGGDRDFLRELIRTTLQEVLEAEMTDALGAAKSERTTGRNGYRSGYYGRSLITRVGKLELRIPQDRTGQFSTELFERYQRSERALVAALAEMYVQGCRRARSRRLPKSYVGIAFQRLRSARSINASTRAWPNSQRGR